MEVRRVSEKVSAIGEAQVQALKDVVAGLMARADELDAQVRELAARVNRSTPDANVQKALEAAQKAAEDAAKLTSVTRSLEAKCEALSRAVGEVKTKLAKHDAKLAKHRKELDFRYKDDKVFAETFHNVFDRLEAVERGLEQVTTWVRKLHPNQLKRR